MHNLRVLLTGCGAPGTTGTIRCIRNYFHHAHIIGVDMNPDSVGRYLVNEFHVVPGPESSTYVDTMISISAGRKADIIIPQTDGELMAVSSMLSRNVRIPILVQEKGALTISLNKAELYKRARGIGVRTAKFVVASSMGEVKEAALSLGYPDNDVFVKPGISSGSRGCATLSSRKFDSLNKFLSTKKSHVSAMTLEEFMSMKEDCTLSENGRFGGLIVSEFLPGSEFSVDCFRDPKSGDSVYIPRRRDVITNGISFETTSSPHNQIINDSKALAESIGLTGVFGFQFIIGGDSSANLIECNPRVQGTMVASLASGANIIGEAIHMALGHQRNREFDIKFGSKLKRVWSFVLTDGKGNEIH